MVLELQVLRKLRSKIIPMNGLCMVYTTIIQPHIDYCLTVRRNIKFDVYKDFKIKYLV